MSVNTAHQNGGVLIYSGECILIYSDNVTVDWSGQDNPLFKGSKHGRIYLTTHRMIFNHKDAKDPMQSFSYPFITLSDVELEQPIFGANYIKGKVRAQPNGNWMGEAKFKLLFKHGGAIDFGQAMLKAAHMATRSANVHDPPPPYVAPDSQWYAAPPPAYAPPPQGYYGWLPPTQGAFPNQPPQNTIFMTDGPPPYPGVNVPGGGAGGGYGPPPPQGGGGGYGPPQYGGGGAGFQQPPQGGYPDQNGGYPPQQGGGYPPQQGAGGGGYPPQNGAYPPQSGGFPLQNGGGYPPQNAGYPPQNGAYPPQQGGYPAPSGYPQFQQGAAAGGFQDAKAAEAAQSAYYDPNRPQMAYVPPPSYYENPPSYQDATHKKDQ